MKKEIFVFIGPPGAGKGSLSTLCTQHFNWMQLSTGNLCRKHIQEQTAIGKEIAFAIKSGKLISDDLVNSMVEQWLTSNIEQVSSLILDGYPRVVMQAQIFDTLLRKRFPHVTLHVIKLSIPDERVVERLTCRLICQNSSCQAIYSKVEGSVLRPAQEMVCDRCKGPLGQRDDDAASAVRERLIIYHHHTNQLLDYYRAKNQAILELDVADPLPKVFERFAKLIEHKKAS